MSHRELHSDQDSPTYTPCCEEARIVTRDGDRVCANCGTIVGKDYVASEKPAFTAIEVEARKRTEPRWREIGPRTVMAVSRLDSNGNVLNARETQMFSRLSKIHHSLTSSIERNFWDAKPKLKLLTSMMSLPNYVRETAWRIYSEAAKKRLTMGRSIAGFVAAAVYAAIRVHELPRLLDEVCEAILIPRRAVHRSLGLIVQEVLPKMGLKYKPITAEQLIFRFGADLALPMDIQKKAATFLTRAFKAGMKRYGKDPRGVAASALYLAALYGRHRKTQSRICEVAKVTEVTLRSRSKQIKPHISLQ